MKHIISMKNTAAALAVLSSVALGAGGAVAQQPMPASGMGGMNWTGPYAGLFGGYGWGKSHASPIDDNVADVDHNGALAGGHVGFNQQYEMWVFGGEADMAWSNMENDVTSSACNPGAVACEFVDVKWLSTVRARAGYAVERALLYATAGLALAGVKAIDFDAGPEHENHMHVGWTAGAGVEYAFNNMFTGKIEYLYTDLGSKTYDLGTPDDVDISGHAIKVGGSIMLQNLMQ